MDGLEPEVCDGRAGKAVERGLSAAGRRGIEPFQEASHLARDCLGRRRFIVHDLATRPMLDGEIEPTVRHVDHDAARLRREHQGRKDGLKYERAASRRAYAELASEYGGYIEKDKGSDVNVAVGFTLINSIREPKT